MPRTPPSESALAPRPDGRAVAWQLPASLAGGPPPAESGYEVRRVTSLVRRRKGIIAFGLVSVLASVALFTLIWPRTYESSALIVVEQRDPGNTSPALEFLGQLGRASQIETEIELLKSRNVVANVVQQLDLHTELYPPVGPTTSLRTRLQAALPDVLPFAVRPAVPPASMFPRFEAGADAVPGRYLLAIDDAGGLVVRNAETRAVITRATRGDTSGIAFAGIRVTPPDPPTLVDGAALRIAPFTEAVSGTLGRLSAARRQREADLIELTCTGSTPESAQALCQAVLDSYIALRTDLRRAEARATADFLGEQVDLLKSRLRAAEDSLEAYGTRNRIVALEERAAEEVRQYTQLNAQRNQMEAERSALAGWIAQIERGGEGTRRYRDLAAFPTFFQNGAVTQFLVELVELDNQRSELMLKRSPQSSDVQSLNERIAAIEQQFLAIAKSHERALATQIRSLDQNLWNAGGTLSTIPRQQVQSARLERERSLLGDLYSLLETRLREAEVAKAVNLPNVRIVDAAALPYAPAAPNTRLNLLLGLVLGGAFGILLALLRESTDNSVRDREEAEHHLGLPVLSMIPHLKGPGAVLPVPDLRRPSDSRRLHHSGTQWVVRARGGLGRMSQQDVRGNRFRLTEERWVALESFRALATDLRYATRHLNGKGRAVAVTSALRGEGKTFVACNLALARAAQGARTLLIDADIRGGGVTRFFGFDTGMPGLTGVLAADADLKSAWRGQVNSTELWVMPAGRPGLYSSQMFESKRFAALLERSKLEFDLVVIDTPPVTMITDATAVAAAADAVVMVVRGGTTDRNAVDHALERLQRADAEVVGSVLNDVELPEYYGNRYDYVDAVEVGRS